MSNETVGSTVRKMRVGVINILSKEIFEDNFKVGWWNDFDVENVRSTNDNNGKMTKEGAIIAGCKLALCHSELSEALEGMRKGLKDDHLPERPMLEVELADAVIRILDLAGACDLDIGGAIIEKLEYNRKRSDHKMKNRMSNGGKTV